MATVKNRELITQAEYARRRGVSQAAVNKAVRRCGIPLIEGRVDPMVADVLWRERTDPEQQRRALAQQRERTPAPTGPEIDQGPTEYEWRKRREAAEAQRAELNLRKEAGELVERAAMRHQLDRRISAIGAQFDALIERGAATLGMNDEHRLKVRQFLRDELAQIRTCVADLGMQEAA